MSFQPIDNQVLTVLNQELEASLDVGHDVSLREKAAARIRLILNGLSRELSMKGEVHMFGSYSNGFKTGTSDLDVVFIGSTENDSVHSILGQFATRLVDLGFENVTKIFQANVPLLKLSDRKSDMEVDFCINNELGTRNSMLLKTYCSIDDRVLQLGRLVKDWAKKHELVGTADGCLNSYAYMLLVIYFLQTVQPPVAPNLQGMEFESHPVSDRKWGDTDIWETGFFENVSSLPKSTNEMSLGELLTRFFHFYTRVFDWRSHAVCMRLQRTGTMVDKFTLKLPTNDDQWYVEDPFDLKHNLAGKCSRNGKKRIMDEMASASLTLSATGLWSSTFPSNPGQEYFMKCRISQAVTPQALLEEFEEFDLVKLHFPKPDGNIRLPTAFLAFPDSSSRRRAHTKNEKYIADCQLQLHYSSQHSLAEAVAQCNFSTFEMASYKMQRQVLAARVQGMSNQDALVAPGLTQQPAVQSVTGYKDMSAEAAGYNYNQRALPQTQLPQQPPGMLWPQDQQMQGMQMQQMQQQQQQMQQMQQKVEPIRSAGGLSYNPNQTQPANQWGQHQQMWPQHPQQMQQPPSQPPQQLQSQMMSQPLAVPIQTQQKPPPPPPPLQQAAPNQKKSSAEKEAEKQEKKSKAKAKAEAKAAAQAAQQAALVAKQKAAAALMTRPKTTPIAGAGAGAGWLDVQIFNKTPEKPLLNPELADKLAKLNQFYSKFESVDKQTRYSEVRLEVDLKDNRTTMNGNKQSAIFTAEQWDVIASFQERFKKLGV